jgi:hypothetical protein
MTTSGRLAYVNPPVPVDTEFVARAHAQGSPEQRFRFAGTCVSDSCPQWTGEGCAVADMAADAAPPGLPSGARLPSCSMRASCRWFFQRGVAACLACPLLVADMGGTETYRSAQAAAAQDSRNEY